MKTYIVIFKDKEGYTHKDLFTDASDEIVRWKLEQEGCEIVSIERYA